MMRESLKSHEMELRPGDENWKILTRTFEHLNILKVNYRVSRVEKLMKID